MGRDTLESLLCIAVESLKDLQIFLGSHAICVELEKKDSSYADVTILFLPPESLLKFTYKNDINDSLSKCMLK